VRKVVTQVLEHVVRNFDAILTQAVDSRLYSLPFWRSETVQPHLLAIRCQFHQRFYVRIFRTNVVSASFSSYIPALASKFRTKNARVNVDEIDTRSEASNFSLEMTEFNTYYFQRTYIVKICLNIICLSTSIFAK